MWAETMWGQYLQIPWDQLFSIGGPVRHAVNAQVNALNQQALRDLSDVTMSPGRWHEVERMLSLGPPGKTKAVELRTV